MKRIFVIAVLALGMLSVSCKKKKEETIPSVETSDVIADFAHKVAFATYLDLENKANELHSKILLFNSNNSSSDLEDSKRIWKETRAAWEQSEGFLFGPVATQNLDPGIDDWPINKADLDSILASNQVFSQGFLDSTQTTLKGFHPMEYLLFGVSGNKVSSEFTAREKEYLVALADYLKRLTTSIRIIWDPNLPGNYTDQLITAGEANSHYTSQRAVFEEIINAMIGICEEVAEAKIQEPLVMQDPSLEESPFSQNSMTDFTNNIRSVQNVYLGSYKEDGIGLNEWVNANNISLDNAIQQKITIAINSFSLITLPFGQAILTQQNQLNTLQQNILELKNVLENELLPFVQTTITD